MAEFEVTLYAQFVLLENSRRVSRWFVRPGTTIHLPPFPGNRITVPWGGGDSLTGLELTIDHADEDLCYKQIGVVMQPYSLIHEKDGGADTLRQLLQDLSWKKQFASKS